MAGHLGASQFEFDDRQMYFTSLPLSSVNCLETTLLVKVSNRLLKCLSNNNLVIVTCISVDKACLRLPTGWYDWVAGRFVSRIKQIIELAVELW